MPSGCRGSSGCKCISDGKVAVGRGFRRMGERDPILRLLIKLFAKSVPKGCCKAPIFFVSFPFITLVNMLLCFFCKIVSAKLSTFRRFSALSLIKLGPGPGDFRFVGGVR